MTNIDPAALAAAGFSAEIGERKSSIVLAVEALSHQGKTNFAFTAPKPLLYQPTEDNYDGVLQKFQKGQQFEQYAGQIIFPWRDKNKRTYHLIVPNGLDRKGVADLYHNQFYLPFRADAERAIQMGVRTIVWDNGGDVWEGIRLSVYGGQATSADNLRTEANTRYRELLRYISGAGVNLIILHQLKTVFESYMDMETQKVKWKPKQPTEYEAQGNEKVPYLVNARIRLNATDSRLGPDGSMQPCQYTATVMKCVDNRDMVGFVLDNPSFPMLMSLLVPSVDPEKWR